MKGSPDVIKALNELVATERACIVQSMTHAAICECAGYEKLEEQIEHRISADMKHIEKLLCRILFLEGNPNAGEIKPVTIGETVIELLPLDVALKSVTIATYAEAISVAEKASDFGTRKLLESIIEDEDNHLAKIEQNITQIAQLGYAVYLMAQIKE